MSAKRHSIRIVIRNRNTGEALFTTYVQHDDPTPLRTALDEASLNEEDLAWAHLAGASLVGADLDGTNFAEADLAGADLTDAVLTGTNFTWANLAGTRFTRANLAGATFYGANLSGANFDGANLVGAYLAEARCLPPNIKACNPLEPYRHIATREKRHARMAAFRARNPEIPIVDRLDARILEIVDSGSGHLDMLTWHTCETTHCRAGWAIHLAGAAGAALEKAYGPREAGGLIYRASTGHTPDFYANNERALADIRRCAAEEE